MLRAFARRIHGASCAATSGCRFRPAASVAPGAWRQEARVDGVTVVSTEEAARAALRELERLQVRPHAWDTETADLTLSASAGRAESPVCHGRVVCATCYCGSDADFGSGPRLFIDNSGPAEGLLERVFKPYFEDERFKKVFHNFSFDCHMLRRHNIHLQGFYADTMHMARIFDTSRASWEGREKMRQSRLGGGSQKVWVGTKMADAPPKAGRFASVGDAHAARQTASPPLMRAIMGVRLGGASLDRGVWAAQSGLHTLPELPPEPDPGDDSSHAAVQGYRLKNLATYFGLSCGQPQTFDKLFGTLSNAADEAHNSPERFPDWVRYATQDAVLTFNLFELLQKELSARPWTSQLHQPPIEEVLLNPHVLYELSRGKPALTYSSEQYNTSQTMWDLYKNHLLDLAPCLNYMEKTGVGVDLDCLREIEERASERVAACCKSFSEGLASLRGADGALLNPDAGLINVRSSKQLQWLLFGGAQKGERGPSRLGKAQEFPAKRTGPKRTFTIRSLGLTPSNKSKDFTPAGSPSTSAEVLREFAGDRSRERVGTAYQQLIDNGFGPEEAELVCHSLEQLSEVRRISSLLDGFARPLQQYGRKTGRIHPSWQFDTATGRLACRNPNLQNLPASASECYGIRDAFRAAPGNVLVVADYSQLELRILAHVARCPSMIKHLSGSGDYHSGVAAEMFPHVRRAIARGEAVVNKDGTGRPTVKELFGAERSKAKAVSFGIIYGMAAGTLAEDLGVATCEAQGLIDAWYQSKPEVQTWMQRIQKDGYSKQLAVSILGRCRHLPFMNAGAEPFQRSRSSRAAVNFGIQGSAADVVLAAMLQLWRHPWLIKHGFHIVMQVHDEFVLEGPEESSAEAVEVVREAMMQPFQEYNPKFRLEVPLFVDVGVGSSFGRAKA